MSTMTLFMIFLHVIYVIFVKASPTGQRNLADFRGFSRDDRQAMINNLVLTAEVALDPEHVEILIRRLRDVQVRWREQEEFLRLIQAPRLEEEVQDDSLDVKDEIDEIFAETVSRQNHSSEVFCGNHTASEAGCSKPLQRCHDEIAEGDQSVAMVQGNQFDNSFGFAIDRAPATSTPTPAVEIGHDQFGTIYTGSSAQYRVSFRPVGGRVEEDRGQQELIQLEDDLDQTEFDLALNAALADSDDVEPEPCVLNDTLVLETLEQRPCSQVEPSTVSMDEQEKEECFCGRTGLPLVRLSCRDEMHLDCMLRHFGTGISERCPYCNFKRPRYYTIIGEETRRSMHGILPEELDFSDIPSPAYQMPPLDDVESYLWMWQEMGSPMFDRVDQMVRRGSNIVAAIHSVYRS